MNVWIGGEIEADIGDIFRSLRNEIELEINQAIFDKDYGNGLKDWDIIIKITEENGKESIKYNPRTRSTDIRSNINYFDFKGFDRRERKRLIWNCLIQSIDRISKMKIKNVDWTALKKDLLAIRNKCLNAT